MRAAAYCRVSTKKGEQLDSMESQQNFFSEYSKKNDYNLVKIYADEGKSGTKMKNRDQLQQLLSDADRDMFDIVLIKDVSRLARNVVDFLISFRRLSALNIKIIFVNYDQTTSDNPEFMLTLLSAIAQEESANTSKRIKFGKKMNAEKGRVPNYVFGYNKRAGEYFNLEINAEEAEVVCRIFNMYVEENFGANKIAMLLNEMKIRTKRNCNWTQNAISRILSNQIYTGKIINGKEVVENFLTGKRKLNDEDNWLVTDKPDLRIISDDQFDKAQRILSARAKVFNITGERHSEKHVFSKLIKCKCCNSSFRKSVRKYKNTYIRWICTGRNSNGAGFCPNKTVIDENELLRYIKGYFVESLSGKSAIVKSSILQFSNAYRASDENNKSERELVNALNRAQKDKQKQIEMFEDDIITREELKSRMEEIKHTIMRLTNDLELVRNNVNKGDILTKILKETFDDLERAIIEEKITNNVLARVIDKITVDEYGNVDIFLKVLVT